MNQRRNIKKVIKSTPTIEGAGVHLKRGFGFRDVPLFDPFLLFDDFRSNNPSEYLAGFPWHPHRGIETITYVLDGAVEHGDSLGNRGTIRPGDVQWMTAGSGIIHQEMPKGNSADVMGGFQLWANLPRSQKMIAPRYRDVKSTDIPEVTADGEVKVRIVSGSFNGVRGPVRDVVIDPEYLDVAIPPNTAFRHAIPRDHMAFAYVIGGKAYFDQRRDAYAFDEEGVNYFDMERDCLIGSERAILFDDGDEVIVESRDDGVRFLLVSGKPLGEPVAWYGPIVMNTHEELRTAFEDLRKGTFIKQRP